MESYLGSDDIQSHPGINKKCDRHTVKPIKLTVQIDVGDSFVMVMVEDDGNGFEVLDLEEGTGDGS